MIRAIFYTALAALTFYAIVTIIDGVRGIAKRHEAVTHCVTEECE